MSLTEKQAALVKGMLARGDHQHEIAAYFRVNPGRVAEIKNGSRFAGVEAAIIDRLPPAGASYSFTPELDPEAPLDEQVETLKLLIVTTPPLAPAKVYLISPELADWTLKNLHRVLGHGNRSQRRTKINTMISAIRRGLFPVTGDTIKFGAFDEGEVTNGMGLLDGQNRLIAIAEGGRPVATYIVFGIDRDAFRNMDIGAGRTGGDTFKVYGETYPGKLSGATRWLRILDDWRPPAPPARGLGFTNEELWDYFRKRVDAERLRQAVRDAVIIGRLLPTNSLAALLYRFNQADPDCAKLFVHDLQQRVRGGGVIIGYSEKLKRDSVSRVHENVYVAAVILAWNQYRAANYRPNAQRHLRWDVSKDFPSIT